MDRCHEGEHAGEKECACTCRCARGRTGSVLVLREGVRRSAMLLEEALVCILCWVLCSTEEEHVLKEVRETRKFLGIARRSNGDIGARGRVVAFRVGDQQQLQIVGELKVAVLAIIQIGLVNVLC